MRRSLEGRGGTCDRRRFVVGAVKMLANRVRQIGNAQPLEPLLPAEESHQFQLNALCQKCIEDAHRGSLDAGEVRLPVNDVGHIIPNFQGDSPSLKTRGACL